jgi:hypothetical protein
LEAKEDEEEEGKHKEELTPEATKDSHIKKLEARIEKMNKETGFYADKVKIFNIIYIIMIYVIFKYFSFLGFFPNQGISSFGTENKNKKNDICAFVLALIPRHY